MSTATATPSATTASPVLRRLYLGRFVFAVAWAGVFASASSPFGSLALVLAVLYPAVDVASAAIDIRSASAAGRSTTPLALNMAISTAAGIALLVVGTGEIGDVLLVWGFWAFASGLVQLTVALQRRALKGQVPLIISGAISVLDGVFFAATHARATNLHQVAGYAALGGVFFLVSALRLGSRVPQDAQ
ncbi:MAG: hypothetical protein ACJ72E_01660 [Marmoricola sp.]